MSRLGDMIRKERLQRAVALKPLAKKSGVSVKFIEDVENGTRIIDTATAQRILKALGASEIQDIEETITINEAPPPMPLNASETVRPKTTVKPVSKPQEPLKPPADAWTGALGGFTHAVPVYDGNGDLPEKRVLALIEGKIAGEAPEKVFYQRVSDDSMAGYRIRKGDLLLCVPSAVKYAGAMMVLEENGKHMARMVKPVDGVYIEITSFDREPLVRKELVKKVNVLGRVVRVEFEV